MTEVIQQNAYISWDGSVERRVCPLATFGSREPQKLHVRLACADPPRADQLELKNAEELQGAIVLVVRGGCSFVHKARLLQRAGVVAMLLANNTREEPLAAFTMGESPDDITDSKKIEKEEITIPCMMMCLRDVRELFQKFPPSVKHGEILLEIPHRNEKVDAVETYIQIPRELYDSPEDGMRWKSIKQTTSSLLKMLEPHHMANSSVKEASSREIGGKTKVPESIEVGTIKATTREKQPPLLAFVQWATSALEYEICFAPLADFCSTSAGASYSGRLVASDPLVADRPLKNAEQLSGAIAIVRRGGCSFPEKIARVQHAGAVAAIVCNDDEEDLDAAFVMSVDHIDAADATLPAVMIPHKTFLRLQAVLNVTTARILCMAGQAADGLLELNGTSVSFRSLPMPVPQEYFYRNKEDSAVADKTTSHFDFVFHLHQACRDGDHAACQRVLANFEGKKEKHQVINSSCPSTGLTALHHACAGGNDNVVELLLSLGAIPNVLDLAMRTPLHVACAENNVKCARLLLRAEASSQQVTSALYNLDDKHDSLPARRTIGGRTALHDAARAGSSECVELLLSANARVEQTSDEESNTFVFLGVSAKDLEGNTPLHLACANAHAECAFYLVAAGADVNCKDLTGRSPLLLACEEANDPDKEVVSGHIIKKLIKAGARIEDCDDRSHTRKDGGDYKLLLDRIESSDLRRDLEMLYLRYEVRFAKQKNSELEKQNECLTKSIDEIKNELSNLHETFREQEDKFQQLQSQIQMNLQFRADCDHLNISSIDKSLLNPLLTKSSKEPAVKSDEELALDAALVRDLGKKCLRQNQNVLAVKYFEQSLELMPLPGVHRLLTTAQNTHNVESNDPLEKKAFADTATCMKSMSLTPAMAPTSPTAKNAKIQKLLDIVRNTNLTPEAHAMLNNELNWLNTLSDDAEFAHACRWTDWLVTLPWEDTNIGLQNNIRHTVKQVKIQQSDDIDVGRHEIEAVRIIQRSYRNFHAAHSRARELAARKIQACVRRNLDKDEQHLKAPFEQNYFNGASISKLDYIKVIDPLLIKKLPREYDVEELVIGKISSNCKNDTAGSADGDNRIVQLVKCVEAHATAMYRTKNENKQAFYFVWTRWGENLDKTCAGILSGPYENQQDAKRRFHRIVCEAKTITQSA